MAKIIDNIEIVNTNKVIPYINNPRKHPQEQIDKIASSIKNFGFTIPIVVDNDFEIIAGHGRLLAAKKLNLKKVPIIKRSDLSKTQAKALRIADNKVAESEWDNELLAIELEELDFDLELTGFDEFELEELSNNSASSQEELQKELDELKDKKPNPRDLPIDFIFTFNGRNRCCLAVEAGLKFGFQSIREPTCPYIGMMGGRHKPIFIDNDYFEYDHEKHLEMVKKYKPKYATVRDAMTRKQCKEDNISYYPLEQILEWAEELNQYAENVIVIPKYDCIDEIPEKFMLGYSIPTSHGGTPLPAKKFKGRKIHLLGGSWKKQLKYLALLKDDVVSIDNNYVLKTANYGQCTTPNGELIDLRDICNMQLSNPSYVALTISFGCIAAKINELYTGDVINGKTLIRQANEFDIDNIKEIADKYNHELGFIIRESLVESIKNRECIVCEVDSKLVGFCKFHIRKDNWTTIYEIAVLEEYRNNGYGKGMIEYLLNRNHTIRLKCPVDNKSNNFYERIGEKVSTVKGKNRNLNLWVIKNENDNKEMDIEKLKKDDVKED